MFEKEAEDYANKKEIERNNLECVIVVNHEVSLAFKDGAEFGYNKAKVEVEESYRESLCNSELNLASVTEQLEELKKANEWYFVKDKLPETSDKYLVYTGGDPFVLEFDTDYNAFGYWVATLGDDLGVREINFETVKDRGEDEVIAWKDIVLPKEIE